MDRDGSGGGGGGGYLCLGYDKISFEGILLSWWVIVSLSANICLNINFGRLY